MKCRAQVTRRQQSSQILCVEFNHYLIGMNFLHRVMNFGFEFELLSKGAVQLYIFGMMKCNYTQTSLLSSTTTCNEQSNPLGIYDGNMLLGGNFQL